MVNVKPENINLSYFDFTYDKSKERLKKASYTFRIEFQDKKHINEEKEAYEEMFKGIFYDICGKNRLFTSSKKKIEITSNKIDEDTTFFIRSYPQVLTYIPIVSHSLDVMEVLKWNTISFYRTISADNPQFASFRIYHTDSNHKRSINMYKHLTTLPGVIIEEDAQGDVSKLEMLLNNNQSSMNDYFQLLQIKRMIEQSNS